MTEILDIAKKDGRWTECPACKEISITEKLKENLSICPHCDFHFRVGPRDRMTITCGKDGFSEIDLSLSGKNVPAGEEGFKCYNAAIKGEPCIIGVMDFSFMGGSLGSGTGERIRLAAEKAISLKRPLIIVSASGGARMHEGIVSLMQMAKTCAAIARVKEAGLPYLSILTDPTTGGVSASYAMVGDLNIAEPKALIGFAGRRVIEQTIKQKLPDDFQTAEYTLAHGFVDHIVPRRELKAFLAKVLRYAGY